MTAIQTRIVSGRALPLKFPELSITNCSARHLGHRSLTYSLQSFRLSDGASNHVGEEVAITFYLSNRKTQEVKPSVFIASFSFE